MLISICMCTFKRPHLINTLTSVGNLVIPEGVRTEIIVVDNDINKSAKQIVSNFSKHTSTDVYYVHEPKKNISTARNAYLAKANGDWIASLDDDEIADRNWLVNLLEAANKHSAQAVFGTVKNDYPPNTPQWIIDGRFFERKEYPTGTLLSSLGAGCTLFRRDCVVQQGMQFDVRYGLSGGEDADFFHRLHNHGYKLIFCKEAYVIEKIEPSRVNAQYLTNRALRIGQSFSQYRLGKCDNTAKKMMFVTLSSVKLGIWSLVYIATLPTGRKNSFGAWLKICDNFGKLSYFKNKNTISMY